MLIKEEIIKLSKGHNLTFDEAKSVMELILTDRVTPVQTAAYLTALHIKGETIEEITGSAMCLREHAEKLDYHSESLEIVGTGGDASHTFNISTTAAIVAAAAGCKVAKHGNRAASSKSGSADVLEELGVNINHSAEESIRLLDELGFCFLYAQKYHCAMKYVSPVRKELGIRTIFNVLGPLTNPACAERQILGVYDEELVKPMAQVLINMGVKRGMSVHGLDGTDEISACAPTNICEFRDGRIESYTIRPEDFGYVPCEANELRGGTPQENARLIRDILSGKEKGAKRNAVCLNAGAAIYIDDKAANYAEGVAMAEQLIESGKARERLEALIEKSQEITVSDPQEMRH